jgi:uncharacterized membrane protein YhdT
MPDYKPNSSPNALEQILHNNWSSAMLSPVIIIFIYSIVQLILHLVWLGGSIGHYVFMLAGSLISFAGISMYTRTFFHSRKKELLAAPSMTIAYTLVFVFACYITFYQGFWGFSELRDGFSIWVILKSVVAIYLGWKLAKTTSEISDEVKEASK